MKMCGVVVYQSVSRQLIHCTFLYLRSRLFHLFSNCELSHNQGLFQKGTQVQRLQCNPLDYKKCNEIQNLIFLVGFLTEIRPNFLKSFCLTTKLPKDESLLLYEDILLYLDN